jgi:hypothetical protein
MMLCLLLSHAESEPQYSKLYSFSYLIRSMVTSEKVSLMGNGLRLWPEDDCNDPRPFNGDTDQFLGHRPDPENPGNVRLLCPGLVHGKEIWVKAAVVGLQKTFRVG